MFANIVRKFLQIFITYIFQKIFFFQREQGYRFDTYTRHVRQNLRRNRKLFI